MVDPLNLTGIANVNTTEIVNSLWNSIPKDFNSALATIFLLAKILLIVVLAYFIILIISKLLKLRDSMNIADIAKNVSEINSKLDGLTRKNRKEKKE